MNRVELQDEIERIGDDLYVALKRAENAEANVAKLREVLRQARDALSWYDTDGGMVDEAIAAIDVVLGDRNA